MYARFFLFCVVFLVAISWRLGASSVLVNSLCDSLYRTKSQAAQQAMLSCYQQQLRQATISPSQAALIHYRMAQAHAFIGSFSEATASYQQAIKMTDDPVQRLHYQEELAFAYEIYGRSFDQALQLREALLASILKLHQPPSREVLSIWCENHIRLAILHQQMGNWEIASSYFQEAEYLVYELEEDRLRFFFQLNWAYFLLESGRPQQAFTVIEPCWQRQASKGADRLIERLFAQVLLGQIYRALDQASLALPLLLSAQKELVEQDQGDFLFHIYIQQEISACYTALARWGAAQAVLEESIRQLAAHTAADYSQINVLSLAELHERLAQVIHQAAQARGKQGEEQAFRQARQAYHYLEQALASFTSSDDQRQQLADFYPVIETFLELLHHRYQQTGDTDYVDLALNAMDLSQNLLLRAQLLPEQQRDCAPELLEEWQLARRQLHQLQLQCRTQKAFRLHRKSAENVDQYYKLVAQQQLCHRLTDQYRANCGKAAIDFERSPSVRQLRQKLPEQESLIQFALGEQFTFVIMVNQRHIRFHRLDQGIKEWEQQVEQFRTELYQSVSSGQELDWRQQSVHLYQQLMEPLKEELTEKLVLIPDGPLWELPFAALITDETAIADQRPAFLVYQHAISYRYTHRLDPQQAGDDMPTRALNVLAFAPDFPAVRLANARRSESLSALNNHWEVDRIAHYFPTEIVKGSQATIENFWSLAPHYPVLHLATHAVANAHTGGFSYLAMGEEQRLQATDLYGHRLPAALVVLSACETGLGEWQRGEGLIGLQRAFFAAGAQSLASTQWKVSDESSALLMGLFYEQLAEGQAKDEALRAAQLAFVDQYPEQAHPFHWAAFTLLGTTKPLGAGDSSPNRRWLIILGLILAGIAIQKRRHASKY